MRLGALRKRKSVLGNDTVDPKVAAFSEIASCVLQVRLVQLATHALCVYQCVCLMRLWDTRSCLVKTRSQRVNRHTKPQTPPPQNCRCSGISEASRRSARNRRSPGPFREQQVAFYLSVSVASSRFDSLMRTSSLRANESPSPPSVAVHTCPSSSFLSPLCPL